MGRRKRAKWGYESAELRIEVYSAFGLQHMITGSSFGAEQSE